MADNYDFEPLEFEACGFQQFHGCCCCAWREVEFIIDNIPDGGGVHALDIFHRVDGCLKAFERNMFWQWPLNDDSSDARIGVECAQR